jgi:hypothetical protein
MVPQSLPEVNSPVPSAVRQFEHGKDRTVDEAETVLAALKRVLENCIGTLEILRAIERTEANGAENPTCELHNAPKHL